MAMDKDDYWAPEVYNAAELYEKYIDTALPRYLLVEQGHTGTVAESLEKRQRLFVYGVRVVKKVEALMVGKDSTCLTPVSIPMDYPYKARILPFKDEDYVYKNVAELGADFPPRVRVTHVPGGTDQLNEGDILKLKQRLSGDTDTDAGKKILRCQRGSQILDLPYNLQASFMVDPENETHSVRDIVSSLPLPQRIQFVRDKRSSLPNSAYQYVNEKDLQSQFLFLKTTDQNQIICTQVQSDQDCVTPPSGTEVLLIPTDKIGLTATFKVPSKYKPSPSSDIIKRSKKRDFLRNEFEIDHHGTERVGLERIFVYDNLASMLSPSFSPPPHSPPQEKPASDTVTVTRHVISVKGATRRENVSNAQTNNNVTSVDRSKRMSENIDRNDSEIRRQMDNKVTARPMSVGGTKLQPLPDKTMTAESNDTISQDVTDLATVGEASEKPTSDCLTVTRPVISMGEKTIERKTAAGSLSARRSVEPVQPEASSVESQQIADKPASESLTVTRPVISMGQKTIERKTTAGSLSARRSVEPVDKEGSPAADQQGIAEKPTSESLTVTRPVISMGEKTIERKTAAGSLSARRSVESGANPDQRHSGPVDSQAPDSQEVQSAAETLTVTRPVISMGEATIERRTTKQVMTNRKSCPPQTTSEVSDFQKTQVTKNVSSKPGQRSSTPPQEPEGKGESGSQSAVRSATPPRDVGGKWDKPAKTAPWATKEWKSVRILPKYSKLPKPAGKQKPALADKPKLSPKPPRKDEPAHKEEIVVKPSLPPKPAPRSKRSSIPKADDSVDTADLATTAANCKQSPSSFEVEVSFYAGDSGQSAQQDSKRGLSNIADIPQDLTTLSVDDIVQCFKMLNLERASEILKAHQVDGYMYMTLTEDLLKHEPFSFSPFEVQKIIQFQKGWRPKLT